MLKKKKIKKKGLRNLRVTRKESLLLCKVFTILQGKESTEFDNQKSLLRLSIVYVRDKNYTAM